MNAKPFHSHFIKAPTGQSMADTWRPPLISFTAAPALLPVNFNAAGQSRFEKD